MISFLFIVMTVLIPAFLSWRIVNRQARFPIVVSIMVAGVFYLAILMVVNAAVPFTSVGDDLPYFRASAREFKTLNDWFDMEHFKQTYEQAGYPLMLAWIHQFAGGSVFVRKVLNILLFLLLAVAWCDIGRIVGGYKVALNFCRGILLCTPLWFYWMFILKDMAIVLLQSLVILGVMCVISRRERKRGYTLIVASTVAIIPFRSMLALANVAFVAASSLLTIGGRGVSRTRMVQIGLSGLIVLAILYIGTRSDILATLGVSSESRSLNVSGFEKGVSLGERIRPEYFDNPLKYLVIFLVGEVAAFNPKSWGGDGAKILRAISMVPWIYFGLPFFLRGSWGLLRDRKNVRTNNRESSGMVSTEISRTYVIILFGFVLMYAGIGWLAGDTTRWRMPSFPPMIAIAVLSWMSMSRMARVKTIVVWGGALSVALVIYYGIFK